MFRKKEKERQGGERGKGRRGREREIFIKMLAYWSYVNSSYVKSNKIRVCKNNFFSALCTLKMEQTKNQLKLAMKN